MENLAQPAHAGEGKHEQPRGSEMPPDRDAGVELLVERVRAGDVRALARAISLVENDSPVGAAGVVVLFQVFGAGLP